MEIINCQCRPSITITRHGVSQCDAGRGGTDGSVRSLWRGWFVVSLAGWWRWWPVGGASWYSPFGNRCRLVGVRVCTGTEVVSVLVRCGVCRLCDFAAVVRRCGQGTTAERVQIARVIIANRRSKLLPVRQQSVLPPLKAFVVTHFPAIEKFIYDKYLPNNFH